MDVLGKGAKRLAQCASRACRAPQRLLLHRKRVKNAQGLSNIWPISKIERKVKKIQSPEGGLHVSHFAGFAIDPKVCIAYHGNTEEQRKGSESRKHRMIQDNSSC